MQRALFLPVTFIALALAACSSSTAGTASSTSTAPPASTSSPDTTLPAPSSTEAPTTVATVPPTTPTTVAVTVPPTLPPAVTAPPTTVPNDGCLRPDAAHEPVEIVISDEGVTINGLPLNITCAKVPESFRFSIVNNSSLEQFVGFGDAGGPIAAGATQLTDPMGEIYSVGDHFNISMAWIEWTIDVEVLPIA